MGQSRRIPVHKLGIECFYMALAQNNSQATRHGYVDVPMGEATYELSHCSYLTNGPLAFNHSLVDPGRTERSRCNKTSSFRAVVLIDIRSLSYSPRLGSSPPPTTMTQSAFIKCTKLQLPEKRKKCTHLSDACLCPRIVHWSIYHI